MEVRSGSCALLLALVCVVAGCAAPQAAATKEEMALADRETPTGSNIVRRDKSGNSGVKQLDKDSIELQRIPAGRPGN